MITIVLVEHENDLGVWRRLRTITVLSPQRRTKNCRRNERISSVALHTGLIVVLQVNLLG